MAKTKQTQGKNPFVQRELSKAELAKQKAWDITPSDLLDLVTKAAEAGYKLSVRYDTFSKCQAAWLIAPEDDSPNSGRILSGRGSTAQSALKQLLFKHMVLLDGDWSVVIANEELWE